MDVQRRFLTTSLDGREWVASRPGYVPLREEPLVPIE